MTSTEISEVTMITRRDVLLAGPPALLVGSLAARARAAQQDHGGHVAEPPAGKEGKQGMESGQTKAPATVTAPPGRVIVPDGTYLPSKMVGGVKEFHLVAEPVKHQLAPGMVIDAWGYNGTTPGPVIEAVEGDRVRILVTNRLPEPTSIHWHGIILPNGMDGVGGLHQPHIKPGDTFAYEFTLRQHGTQMYHPHVDEMVQQALGMMGFFIIHPRRPSGPRVDRDFAIFLQEWAVKPGSSLPDPMVMLDFSHFTFNGQAFPFTSPLVVRRGQRVRVRIANLNMDSHPIHLHGHSFFVTGSDGGPRPQSAQFPETTVNVPVGSTRDVEFIATEPGDWPLHCHKNHHIMNGMGHELPNMIGVDQRGVSEKIAALVPGYMPMGTRGMSGMHKMKGPANTTPMMAGDGPFGPIEMGGMFTLVKVREGIASYDDPGWYRHPDGTVAKKIS